MKKLGIVSFATAVFFAAAGPAAAGYAGCHGPLDILLTNDDGFDAPGITAVREALLDAGHEVTLVAPLTEQSGRGGAITTDVGGTIAIKEEEPGVWSVAGTPADSVNIALELILADNRPDLVVSGANFGANTGRAIAASSGTVAAAFIASSNRIPAIDISVDIDLTEFAEGFPTTIAVFPDAGNFVADVIERLQRRCFWGSLLPTFWQLHINYPALLPEEIAGVAVRRLGEKSGFDLTFADPDGAVAAGGGDVVIGFGVTDTEELDGDALALRQGYISMVLMDGEMTAPRYKQRRFFRRSLKNLLP